VNDIPTTADPTVEIQKLDADIASAVDKNVDVLAASDFKNCRSALTRAKHDIENARSQSETLDDVRTARGYLARASALAQGRQGQAEDLFHARHMAIKAGAGQRPELQSDLADLDQEVAAKADHLSDVTGEKLTDLQKRYADLERRSVVLAVLGKTQALVNGAEKDGAEDKAPISFKNAKLSLRSAEAMIGTSVRNPEGYKEATTKAAADATQLLRVMSVIRKNGKQLDESVAIQMVAQNNKISGLTSDLGAANQQGAADNAAMQSKNRALKSDLASDQRALKSANGQVQIQRVLERARSEFSKAEADAYQQGDTLVIRLKQVNFASGRSDLPAAALPLLAKVSEVAKDLSASQITVQGHTDSVGTAEANKAISEQRAKAVATYFKSNGFSDIKVESEGFGFERPIATNKSKDGRAQNRRVDIIITPQTSIQQ
jgi:outer membrane protein OmpA-like peptidoglycan-associated protein